MNRFDGKTLVITGAASGLGRATVERVAGEGANVVFVEGHGGEPRGEEGGYRAPVVRVECSSRSLTSRGSPT